MFQYHTGPIKRVVQVPYALYHLRFNTTLVQLKVSPPNTITVSPTSFNTTLVQLKGQIRHTVGQPIQSFQYHTGPIKSSRRCGVGDCPLDEFQYHTGPIKSLPERRLPLRDRCFNTTLVQLKVDRRIAKLVGLQVFQYHTGPIKRLQLDPTAQDHDPQFQYHTGPIKRSTCWWRWGRRRSVSIPHWSN